MKRVIALAFLALACIATVRAQDKDTLKLEDLYSPKVTTITTGEGQLERFHGRLMFTGNNRFLTAADVNNDFMKKYYGAQRLQNWGQYLWSLGLSWMASDMILTSVCRAGSNIFKDPSVWMGGALALVGGAMDFGGWVKLGKLADTYNSDPSVRRNYSLELGPTRSGGYGLSLNF